MKKEILEATEKILNILKDLTPDEREATLQISQILLEIIEN